MSVVERLVGLLAPHDCIGCGSEGRLACDDCAQTYIRRVPSRCFHCHRLTANFASCNGCRRTGSLSNVTVFAIYEGLARELIWRLKFSGARAAAGEAACLMRLMVTQDDVCIVPVPTATSRVRRRGYDQAKLLAKVLARETGNRYIDCLRRSGQSHQVGASRGERLVQLNGAFRVTSRVLTMRASNILLVDDVATTGATLEAAAAALRAAGCRKPQALVFAQP